jgi:hypothetical protein
VSQAGPPTPSLCHHSPPRGLAPVLPQWNGGAALREGPLEEYPGPPTMVWLFSLRCKTLKPGLLAPGKGASRERGSLPSATCGLHRLERPGVGSVFQDS